MRKQESSVNQTFSDALDALVDEVRRDHSILAVILCGSLSHDTVWAKSDIDLALVTIDDRKADRESLSLYANGVNVHAFMVTRTDFRKLAEGALRNSFMHSLLVKGRLLYTHDDTIVGIFAGLSGIGERDTRVQLLRAATAALPPIYKAHKWLITRGDLDYSALWILYAATPLAQVEVLSARLVVDREVIPQAMALNPSFFAIVYSELLNTKKTAKSVRAALAAVDDYIGARAPSLFAPVIDYLREAGEARSCSEIENHFSRNLNVNSVTTACEYLADQGLIGKASLPVQLTRRSNVEVEELAFFYLGEPSDA